MGSKIFFQLVFSGRTRFCGTVIFLVSVVDAVLLFFSGTKAAVFAPDSLVSIAEEGAKNMNPS